MGVEDNQYQISNLDANTSFFDWYTKEYAFVGTNVEVLSAQDLRKFYDQHHQPSMWQKFKRIDIYTLVEFFVERNSNGHFIIDECPILGFKDWAGIGK